MRGSFAALEDDDEKQATAKTKTNNGASSALYVAF